MKKQIINKLIEVNLNLIYKNESMHEYYHLFVDENGTDLHDLGINQKSIAEEMESNGLISIHDELCILTAKGEGISDNGGWLSYLETEKLKSEESKDTKVTYNIEGGVGQLNHNSNFFKSPNKTKNKPKIITKSKKDSKGFFDFISNNQLIVGIILIVLTIIINYFFGIEL